MAPSDQSSKMAAKHTICHLAADGRASHWAPGAASVGNGVPSRVMAHGQRTPFEPAMKPTKANMAMRPCLISAWRRKPMVASSEVPQKFCSARLSGSKNLTAGLHLPASSTRSDLVSETTTAARGEAAGRTGAKAEAPTRARARTIVRNMVMTLSWRFICTRGHLVERIQSIKLQLQRHEPPRAHSVDKWAAACGWACMPPLARARARALG
mmetsp:Transcript_12434/g.29206  ORF Transcript_12434/g.29206 Transcript_12434/m.29206 type:complete len:211 (+) Transcript_12434:419-1051(+)